MRNYLFIILVVGNAGTALAQYFQFSQYNFAQQRVNPAAVATSDDAMLGLIYRNQAAAGDVMLKSTLLSASYPIKSTRTGRRWSGVGISLMDDRSAGIFAFQEASISYAVNVSLSKESTLSLGMKGLYQERRLNADGLFTGSQYIPDRGFDRGIPDGENLQSLQSRFFTISAGMHWQQVDKTGHPLAYWGVSLFDFNKPQDSFFDTENTLRSTIVFNGGVQIVQRNNISVMPEFLLTRSAANNVLNAGFVTSYALGNSKTSKERIDMITKYVLNRSAIVGFQWHRETMSLGVSYDFPIISRNAANFSTVEVALALRRLVSSKIKKRSQPKVNNASNTNRKKPVQKKIPVATDKRLEKDSVKTIIPASAKTLPKTEDLKTSLKHKQDSVLASANAGNIRHQPLVLETIMLHFNFEFNSSELDEPSKKYLDDLVEALTENDHLRIKLTGHTDNIGSARFNQRLSLYRAETIKAYLVDKNIDAGRIDVNGKGLTQPLTTNDTEEGRAKNRRVELEIVYEN